MEQKPVRNRHSIFWPLLLVAVGVVLLLTNLDALPGNLWDFVAKYWPLLFVLGGLDQIYQGKNWVGGVITLALGGVMLAGNFNAVPWSGLDLLLRLWPAFIVAAGLDLMMQGRTSVVGGIIIVVLALALVGGMVWVGFAGPGSLGTTTLTIDQPLENARSASLDMTILSGDIRMTGGAPSGQLIEGTLFFPNSLQMSESYVVNAGEGIYQLEPETSARIPFFGPVSSTGSELKVSNSIPMDIGVMLIAGKQDIDLRGIEAAEMQLETIFGRSVVTLPASGQLTGKAGVIFGELVVRVPRGTAVEFQMDTVLVGKNIPQDFLREEDRIYSPEAADGKADIVVRLENVFGSVKIEYLP